MSEPSKAVFLSYASQDAEAAKRLCEALRAAGVEVWFDQSELVGGDSWDAKIRGQISSCALFLPLISANTQARLEGYFRLEWKLAAQRTHTMADEKTFLLPILLDGTRDAEAKVPVEFKAVQWTKLAGGETPPGFAMRVKELLSGEVGASLDDARSEANNGRRQATPLPRRGPSKWWWVPAIFGVTMALLLVLKERRPGAPAKPLAVAPVVPSEISALRAQLVPDRWQQEDYQAMAPRLDRIIRDDPDNADAWALRSIIESLQVTRNFDPGTKPLEAGKNDADRALRLAPSSPLANLAMGMHLVAMISRGGDAQACRPWIDRAVAALPAGPLTRYCDGVSRWLSYDFADSEREMHAWIEAEPHAGFPNWILAQLNMVARRPDQSEQFATEAARDDGITGIRARYTLFESSYYLRADLARCREILQGIPAGGSTVHRVVHARWLMAMAEGRWDGALQELARLPENYLFDRAFHGPKALLAGLAHARAGRADAANAQFREAERLLREHLAADPDNEELHAVLAVALACLGQADAARSELALVEPLVSGRAANVYRGSLVIQIVQARCLLGDYGAMATWMRKLFAEPSAFPFTPASFALDPRFSGGLDAPEIRALLQEFAALAVVPASAKIDDKSVAVLAFANLSDDKANEYFSDGISEELINALGKIPGLKVPARTSSFHFKGKDVPVPEIARQLGVAYVIEGSVQHAGNKVKIGARLTKAADGFQVWTDSFTRDAKDLFAIEEEIAGSIARKLELKLAASSPATTASVNPAAFDAYLRGRQAWNRRTPEGYAEADVFFGRAVALDPNFARAYVGQADVLDVRGWDDGSVGRWDQRDSETLKRIEGLLGHAIALAPDLAEAYASLGTSRYDGWDYPAALTAARRAVELNPNYATGWSWLAEILWDRGEMDEALADAHRALEIDPYSVAIVSQYSVFLHAAGRPLEALTYAERAVGLQPTASRALAAKALALLDLGRTAEAVPLARELLKTEAGRAWWETGMIVARAGLTEETAELLRRYQRPEDERLAASIFAVLGRWPEFFAIWKTRPMVTNQPWFLWEPFLDGVRQKSEFLEVMEQVGLTEAHARVQAWRQAHPPEKVQATP